MRTSQNGLQQPASGCSTEDEMPPTFTQNSEKTVENRLANLRPWPKGISGNPGGRPRKKPLTEKLEQLVMQEAPNADGQTWADLIAKALLQEAIKGDVRAISELANRIEGKPLQGLSVESTGEMSREELDQRIQEIVQQLGLCENCRLRILG